MLSGNHFVDASIILKRVNKESSQDKVMIFEAIPVSEDPFTRRASKDKKDESGGSNSSTSSGSNRGPNLPPQPSRKSSSQTVHPNEVKKVLPDEVWQPLSKSIEQTVKKHVQNKKGGNGSNQQK